jgi:hypothetical protein
MWQLLAQLDGMVSQVSEADSGYIFAPNKWQPQLTGDPINWNPLYILESICGVFALIFFL